jgi:hypothetical protein
VRPAAGQPHSRTPGQEICSSNRGESNTGIRMIKLSWYSMRKGKYSWYKAEEGNPDIKRRKQHRYEDDKVF